MLGALLQSRIADRVEERAAGLGAARRAVTDRIADGDVVGASQLAPAAARESLRRTYEAAFASGLNEILLIAAGLALVGLAAALLLVRSRDLWTPDPQPGVRPLVEGSGDPEPGASASRAR